MTLASPSQWQDVLRISGRSQLDLDVMKERNAERA